jgi:hypothetical protein
VNEAAKEKAKPTKTVFFIDQQKFEAAEPYLTVRNLLVDYAKEDPTQTVLRLKDGKDLKRLENLDEVIELKPGMHFIVFHEGPTPVS